MAKTKIEWTDESWNPVTGCDAVSPGCDNCYAKAMAKRLYAMGVKKYENEFKVTCHPDELNKPSHWKKPRRIFVNSMSDLFHHEVPDEFIDNILEIIDWNRQHIFQVLTKRPERIEKCLYSTKIVGFRYLGGNDYLPNLWFGVSAENQKYANERIPQLVQVPAAIRFVSCEPLLGEIDLSEKSELYYYCKECNWVGDIGLSIEKDDSDYCPICIKKNEGYEGWSLHRATVLDMLDWVIIGCESGHHRRPCDLDWVYSLVDQCQNALVPVFVKQLNIDGKVVKDINKFPKDLQIQEFPKIEEKR